MSGHSKWNNIHRKKEKTDAAKAKVFTKMGREITVAVRQGGPDPASNSKLRDIISKAKAANVPNDNIERIIKRASSDDKDNYESITYEGYGPEGVAVMVDTLTDNRNRTASDVRHHFDKFGGNLGATGCVSFLFNEKGVIEIDMEGRDEDKVMEDSMECGADDIDFSDGTAYVYTAPSELESVRSAFEKLGYTGITAEDEYIPSSYVRIEDPDHLRSMAKLLAALDDSDDVQNVWHNLENVEDLPEE
ncbi:MAG: YebC/PmpR family DNA-binding transcriptional regulator [Oscillospiraceae bacterium]|jgi:YebC/PmpR family DNA-binding regulatory protein